MIERFTLGIHLSDATQTSPLSSRRRAFGAVLAVSLALPPRGHREVGRAYLSFELSVGVPYSHSHRRSFPQREQAS